MSSDAPGWVYVITNPAMQDLLKVGFSMKHPSLRADELYHTNNPHTFTVQYEVLVQNPSTLESLVHAELKSCNEGKEWFRCKISYAISAIRKTCISQKIDIIFEQDSSLNEDEKAVLTALKNKDCAYFDKLIWDLWPYEEGNHTQQQLYTEYFIKNWGIDKWEDYPEPKPFRATPETMINFIAQQVENYNSIAANFVIEFLLIKKELHLNGEIFKIDHLQLFGTRHSLNSSNEIKLIELEIKKHLMQNGDIFFTEKLTKEIENIKYLIENYGISEFVKSLPSKDYLSIVKKSFHDYFEIHQDKIIKADGYTKVELMKDLSDWCNSIFFEKNWDVNLLQLINNSNDREAQDISDLFENVKKIHKNARNFIATNVHKIKETIDRKHFVDIAWLLVHTIDYFQTSDYSEAEILMLKGADERNSNDVFNFYFYRGTSTQLFNWRLHFARKITSQGEKLALQALIIARLYATGEPSKVHPTKKPETSKNIIEAKNWYTVVLNNTVIEKWIIKNPSDKNKMMDCRKKAIEGLIELASNEGLLLDEPVLEQVREEASKFGIDISKLPKKGNWLSNFF
jgi:hypothetical protein